MDEIYENANKKTLDGYEKQECPHGIPRVQLLHLMLAREKLPSTPSIKDTVMSTLTVKDIRMREFANATRIISQEIPLLIGIKPKVLEVLPMIVLDLRSAFKYELDFNQQFATSKAADAAAVESKARAEAKTSAESNAAADAKAAAEAQKPKVAPFGWTQVGNIWQGPNGARANLEYYRHPTGDELATRLAALKDD